MSYECKILADSISPEGARLTTMQVTFPRIVLAEFNTHRMLSRNSASSRAIPVHKMIERVRRHPFVPSYWGKNQAGMQAPEELTGDELARAKASWVDAAWYAAQRAEECVRNGLHKQIANRLLEPFLWHTAIVSATEWENFFNLRCHKDAQPEIREIAQRMLLALCESTPQLVLEEEWHLPLTHDRGENDVAAWGLDWRDISVGRCARVSYLTHEGKRDPGEDVRLAKRLLVSGHMSPFEHVARPALRGNERHGNFVGWQQYRQLIPNEAVFKG